MKRSYKIAIIVSILIVVFVVTVVGVLLLTRSNQTSDNPISAPVSQAESQPEPTNVDKLKEKYNTIYLKDHEVYFANYKTGETEKLSQIGSNVEDFFIDRLNSRIIYSISDATIFSDIKTQSENFIRQHGAEMYPTDIKLEEINDYKDIPFKLMSYNLETEESKLLVDYNQEPVVKEDFNKYYGMPYKSQRLQILNISEDGYKVIYNHNGIWVYNLSTNLRTSVDNSERTAAANFALMGTNLLVIRYLGEGRLDKIFRLDGSKYTELALKGIELTDPVGTDYMKDDQVIGINKDDKIIVSDVVYGNIIHNFIYSIDKYSGEATKLFDTGFNYNNACGKFSNNVIYLKTCDRSGELQVNIFQTFTLAGETIKDFSSLSPKPSFLAYHSEREDVHNINLLSYTRVNYGSDNRPSDYDIFVADTRSGEVTKVANSKSFAQIFIFD